MYVSFLTFYVITFELVLAENVFTGTIVECSFIGLKKEFVHS